MVRTGTNLLLLGLLVAGLYAVEPSDTDWGLSSVGALKYLPVMIAVSATPFLLAGSRGLPFRFLPIVSILCFCGVVFFGSVATLILENADLAESFLGRSLCVTAVIPAYLLGFFPEERAYVARRWFPILALLAVLMAIILVLWRLDVRFVPNPHVYHEEAVYFAALAGAALARENAIWRAAQVLACALAAALTVKLTGFGFAAVAMGGFCWRELIGSKRHGVGSLAMRRLSVALGVVSTSALVLSAGLLFRAYLPSGTPAVRLQTYQARWEMFSESPLVGSLFFGSPIMEIGATTIPSHSDLLDVLGFGGLLGIGMFLGPLVVALLHGVRSFREFVERRRALELSSLAFVVAFLFELCFNPVLHQAKLSLLFWFSCGILLADARIDRTRRSSRSGIARRDTPILAHELASGPPTAPGSAGALANFQGEARPANAARFHRRSWMVRPQMGA